MFCGQIFDGKYRIIRTIGEGGMGKVYLAENIKLGTLWAIKEISKRDSHKVSVFVEPNILKKLSHPSLPRIFDVTEDDDYIYVVVDYIDGVSLDKKLKQEGRFPESTVIEWAKQICDVLKYLHAVKPNPIIYRDMKPSNIMLTSEGEIKLIDFGIAREYKTGSDSDTVYIGTKGYAAPEQYGAGQTGVTSDIYSLGVTLYHLLTGKSPNEPPYEIMPLKHFGDSFSEDIERIILKCTKKNPLERYQTVDELLLDINRCYAGGISGKQDTEEGNGSLWAESTGSFANGFRRLLIAVWDNAEFGCELAYTAAKLTGLRVLIIDLDLLNPRADLILNVRKSPPGIPGNSPFNTSGLSFIMDSIEKNRFDREILANALVKRREVKNLFILTGSYNLHNYEYFDNDTLVRLIEKTYQDFDLTVLLISRWIYDSYTVISLIKSDVNIIAVRADVDRLREFNRYLCFLKETQQMPFDKTKFVAFEYNPYVNLSETDLKEITEHNYIGHVRYSVRREKYRNLKAAYVRRMEREVLEDYKTILSALNILPGRMLNDRVKEWMRFLFLFFRPLAKTLGKRCKRGSSPNADNRHVAQTSAGR